MRRLYGLWALPLVCWLAASAPSTLQAQTVVATLDLAKSEPRPDFFEYVPADEGLVTIAPSDKKSSRSLSLYKYDAALRRQWTRELLERTSNQQIEQLEVVGDKILVFIREFVPRERSLKLLLAQYDLQGRSLGKPIDLFTSSHEKELRPLMRYERSLDRKRLLVIGEIDPPRKREEDKVPLILQYALFDVTRDSVRRGRAELPFVKEQFRLEQVRMHSGTNIYVLGRFKPDADRDYFEFRLLRFLPNGAVKDITLQLPGRIIVDLTTKTDPQDNLVVAGFYGDRSADRITGTLVSRFEAAADSMGPIIAQPLDANLLTRMMPRAAARRGMGLTDFYLDQMVLRSDGGLMLLAERFFENTNTYRDAFGYFVNRTELNYQDILALSIGPSGLAEWSVLIPKAQVGDKSDQLSYSLLVGAEEMYILYKAFTQTEGDNVYYHTLNADGELSPPHGFFRSFRGNDVFYRASTTQVNNHEAILVYYQSGPRTLTLAKVQF